MKFKSICLLTTGFLLFNQITLATNSITYQNTRGSILDLHFNENHTLSGTFTSAVASKECPQAIGMKRPIVGFIAKNALTISVSYPECGVVNFIGNIEDNKDLIDTIAIVVHPSHNIAKEGPGSRMIGHDVFHKISK